ncbi:hypothetical protein [Thiolapillus sp.]
MRIFIEDSAGDVISCNVDGLVQNEWGDVIVDNPACLDAVEDNPVNDDKLVLGSKRCGFSAMRMDATGRIVITASNPCVIPQPVAFTLRDDDFSMECETDILTQDSAGVLNLQGSECAYSVKEGDVTGAWGTMVLSDGPLERSCDFGGLSMDDSGNIVVTARGSCFGDSDGDLIPDPVDPDNATAATDECLIQGDASWETVSISGARYLQDVTCQLPKPEYIVVADVVFGGYHHEPLSYPPDQPIVADYHATNSILLLGPVSVKGGSSFTIDSGRELRIWGPFKVTAGSEFRVVPLLLIHED